MEERKIVQFKKDELKIKEFIKKSLGKGKISNVRIEYTPIGEKIIISTNKPGLVIGRRGEKINELTRVLKRRFKLENPHIDIDEIINQNLDAQLVADDIALSLERMGPLKFKVISYRTLQRIIDSGAVGVELRLSGKLPSSRARTWRFAYGYLKKTGNTSKVVDKAKAVANTKPGVVGIKVSILRPDVELHDRIELNDEIINKIKMQSIDLEEEKQEIKIKKTKKTKSKRTTKKSKEKK